MDILYIHHHCPYPVRSGMDKVTYNLIKTLSTEHNVTLVYPFIDKRENEAENKLIELCAKIVRVKLNYRNNSVLRNKLKKKWFFIKAMVFRVPVHVSSYYHSEVKKALKRLTKDHNYDIIQASSIYTEKYLRFYKNKKITVLGPIDDVLAGPRSNLENIVGFIKKFKAFVAFSARKKQETIFIKYCDFVSFISDTDAGNVKKRLNKYSHKIFHCPVDSDAEVKDSVQQRIIRAINVPEEFQINNRLIFIGNFAAERIQIAYNYFIENILPLIEEKIPDVKFYAVGKNPPESIIERAEKKANIIITGEVSDEELIDHMLKSAVFIAPSLTGAGIKTKTLHAMSLGKAIVATNKEIEGFREFNPEAIKVFDDPESFAEAVLLLLTNPQERYKMGRSAYELYHNHYSKKALTPQILALYYSFLN